ncbi:MAG: hypothetical protein R2710_20095 [Acidimicrobiales bacterium]
MTCKSSENAGSTLGESEGGDAFDRERLVRDEAGGDDRLGHGTIDPLEQFDEFVRR